MGEARRRRPDPVELPRVPRLSVPRLSDDLAERIRRFIIRADIAEGARLPPERDLAEWFGASRPTVNQAPRSLSLMGLVEIRRGSGAYVVRRPEAMVTASVNLMLDLDQGSLSDLMRLRLVRTAVLSFEYRQWVERGQVPDWLRRTSPEQQRSLHEPSRRPC